MLDLCAGTGCIGLAVAANAPESRVLLGDISEGAVRSGAEAQPGLERPEQTRHLLCVQRVLVKSLKSPHQTLTNFSHVPFVD